MVVTHTVKRVGGGVYTAYSELNGDVEFNIFDINRTVFVNHKAAFDKIAEWKNKKTEDHAFSNVAVGRCLQLHFALLLVLRYIKQVTLQGISTRFSREWHSTAEQDHLRKGRSVYLGERSARNRITTGWKFSFERKE